MNANERPGSGKPSFEVMSMAKQGMKRPEPDHKPPKNDVPPVPEIKGKAKHGNGKAKPIKE